MPDSGQHDLRTIVGVVKNHVERLKQRGITHFSGLDNTDFKPLTSTEKKRLLQEEAAALQKCQRCELAQKRRQVVYGEGDPAATLMFIGEGPGEVEDETGRPFVGPAGNLLDKIIQAMGLQREQVYIANIVKCRPPGNRNPEKDEIVQCFPFLDKQITIIKPRVIISLGAPATKSLLRTAGTISKLRGRFHEYRSITVMPTYHPSYLLRNPAAKRDTWQDVQQVMHYLKTGEKVDNHRSEER